MKAHQHRLRQRAVETRAARYALFLHGAAWGAGVCRAITVIDLCVNQRGVNQRV